MDDFSMPIGMSVGFVREDLESASQVIVALGFEGIEVFLPHLGPGLNGVTLMPAHAAAARELLEQRGLRTTVLNCIVGNFEPLRGGTSLLAASHRCRQSWSSPRNLEPTACSSGIAKRTIQPRSDLPLHVWLSA